MAFSSIMQNDGTQPRIFWKKRGTKHPQSCLSNVLDGNTWYTTFSFMVQLGVLRCIFYNITYIVCLLVIVSS